MRFGLIEKEDMNLLRRSMNYLKPYKIKLMILFLIIITGIVISFVQPLIWGKLIVSLVNKNFEHTLYNIIYTFFLYVAQILLDYFKSLISQKMQNNITNNIKCDMYDKILNLPVKAFDEMRVGDFISRLQGDASALTDIITNQLLEMIIAILRIIVMGIAVFSINVYLSIVIVMLFPISYVIFKKYSKQLRIKNQEIRSIYDDYFSFTQQSILGIREIKSNGLKSYNSKSYDKLSVKLMNKSTELGITGTVSRLLSQSTNFISEIAIMGLGGYFIFRNLITLDYFIAFSSYSRQFSNSLLSVVQINTNFQQMLTSLERIFALMDSLNYDSEKFGESNIETVKGEVSFEDVYFNYIGNTSVLKGVSFKLEQNKKYAVVGKSGEGKTTLFNLLMRFYDANSGEILIDGINISEFNEKSLRAHISIIRQEPFLFNTSIKENLLLANPNATDDQIINACKEAHINDFINTLPDQYNSIIGENSVNLSGGQKQRIAIARALLKKSKILLFDEATSSLDNESEICIRQAINNIAKNHTVIVIAHRLSTIVDSHKIIVLQDGKASIGSHNSLMEKNDIYKKLYEHEISNEFKDLKVINS